MLIRPSRLKNALCGLLLATAMLSGLSFTVAARELTADEKQVVADAVRERLRDPSSAMFKWGSIVGEIEPADDSSASAIYCGHVNSRNAYGGFVGDKPFGTFLILVDDVVVSAVVLGLGGGRRETAAANDFCGQNGYDAEYFAGVR